MPALFDPASRTVLAWPVAVLPRTEFEYRRDGGEWTWAGEQGAAPANIPAHPLGGRYEVRMRGVLPDGAKTDWFGAAALDVPRDPTVRSVDLDDAGCVAAAWAAATAIHARVFGPNGAAWRHEPFWSSAVGAAGVLARGAAGVARAPAPAGAAGQWTTFSGPLAVPEARATAAGVSIASLALRRDAPGARLAMAGGWLRAPPTLAVCLRAETGRAENAAFARYAAQFAVRANRVTSDLLGGDRSVQTAWFDGDVATAWVTNLTLFNDGRASLNFAGLDSLGNPVINPALSRDGRQRLRTAVRRAAVTLVLPPVADMDPDDPYVWQTGLTNAFAALLDSVRDDPAVPVDVVLTEEEEPFGQTTDIAVPVPATDPVDGVLSWPFDGAAFAAAARSNGLLALADLGVRCAGNAVNAFIRDERVAVAYLIVNVYRVLSASADNPEAPTVTWEGAEDAPFAGWTPSAGWQKTVPPAPNRGQVIYCSTATLVSSNAAKSVVGSFPVVCARAAADGKVEEVIYGAKNGAALAAAEHPLNSWTFGYVARAPRTRGGVKWASSLELAGYGAAKPYGFRATRLHDPNDAVGAAVADAWLSQPFAHFGLDGHDGQPGQDGRLSNFGYNNRSGKARLAAADKGAYRFFYGPTATAVAGSGVKAQTWRSIQAATYVELSRLDRRGLPCLVLDDLTEEDWLVFEPASGQWATFDLTGAPVPMLAGGETTGYRVPVAFASGTGDANPSAAAAARFLFSAPRRQQPAHAKTYKFNENIGGDFSETAKGDYLFLNNTTTRWSYGNVIGTGAGKFAAVVATAKRLWIHDEDEFGNDALAFDKLDPDLSPTIVWEISRQQWAAWEITGRTRSGQGWTFDLELVAYDARGGLTAPAHDDVLFRASEFAPDAPGSVFLTLTNPGTVVENAPNPSITATLSGNSAPVMWHWLIVAGGSVASVTQYVRADNGSSSTRTITLNPIEADVEITVRAIARIPTTGRYLDETVTFDYEAE